MRSKIITIIVCIVSFVAFVVAKDLVKTGMNEYNEHKAVQKAYTEFSEVEKEAKIRSQKKGTMRVEEMKEMYQRKAINDLNSYTDKDKKRDSALTNFMGYYLINIKTRKEFCNNYGIDISDYINEFARGNKSELDLARKYVFKKKEAENKIYNLTQKQLKEMIQIDMDDISNNYGLSHTDTCKLFSGDNGISLGKEMKFSKQQPLIHQMIYQN